MYQFTFQGFNLIFILRIEIVRVFYISVMPFGVASFAANLDNHTAFVLGFASRQLKHDINNKSAVDLKYQPLLVKIAKMILKESKNYPYFWNKNIFSFNCLKHFFTTLNTFLYTECWVQKTMENVKIKSDT